MIEFSKSMYSAIKGKTVTKEELSKYLLSNLTVIEIADELADYIMKETPASQPIAVTEEEYERICSMFRVKGQRMVDGNYIKETRGRKPVTNKEQ
jgi:hypothetical protein